MAVLSADGLDVLKVVSLAASTAVRLAEMKEIEMVVLTVDLKAALTAVSWDQLKVVSSVA